MFGGNEKAVDRLFGNAVKLLYLQSSVICPTMRFIAYFFYRFFILLFSIMPFWVAYLFADLAFVLVYYIVPYRKKVVVSNLTSSFPEKSKAEIAHLTRKFYLHLANIMVESLKGLSMSKAQIIKRHRVVNPELMDAYYAKGQSVIGVTAHYGNWEWGAFSGGVQVKLGMVAFYKPITNKLIDGDMKRRRSKFNSKLASIRETAMTFKANVNHKVAFLMAADQAPSNLRDCYWLPFLNHPDTPWLHGPEKYARLYNLPVIYVDIQRVKRGYYELTLSTLADSPNELPDGEITARYARKLEQAIIAEPTYWLWSHRRWKRKKQAI
ncbi:KDO2-lipid IV(A) lauroyltransferase [Williamwhitmania taraxaci]|uniref:KDO2-lipid IV(A) lauroyltransferase n=2 Tax=Williamwhitmania taraxaci TaxID=1640674 RepID=A0A1G6MN10_9BACT|nr:KDO2-lipid IV(A) lauroyltransferase [Williamwhitmania taraxaci]